MAEFNIRLYGKAKNSYATENAIGMGIWCHLLLRASVRGSVLPNGREIGECEVCFSSIKLSRQLEISRKVLRRFLDIFEREGMVKVVKRDRNGTVLSICQFKTYQPQFYLEGQQRNSNGTATGQKTNSNEPHTNNLSNLTEPKKPNSGGASARFVPPSLEEVSAYCQKRNNFIDPEQFIDHYQSQGWKKSKGAPVKDWKACVRTWEKNGLSNGKPKEQQVIPL